MAEKQGEAPGAFHHPALGAITFAYGDANMGLRHIEKKRGIEYVNRIPDVLRKGRLLRDEKLPRAYLVTDDNPPHVVTIRLDFDGKAKTWVITSFDDDQGKFAQQARTSNVPPVTASPRIPDATGQTQSSPSVAKKQPAAWEEDDEEAVFDASMSTKQKQDMYGHLVRDKMISAPSFPALFAAAKSYVKSTGKDRGVDYVKKRLDDLEKSATDNPWDLLVMHTFLWNAKSARAQTLQTLAFKKQKYAGKCAA